MRADIRMLCVTNWGAVLEVKLVLEFHYANNIIMRGFTVGDPDAFDSGYDLCEDGIKLTAKLKSWKAMPRELIEKHKHNDAVSKIHAAHP